MRLQPFCTHNSSYSYALHSKDMSASESGKSIFFLMVEPRSKVKKKKKKKMTPTMKKRTEILVDEVSFRNPLL